MRLPPAQFQREIRTSSPRPSQSFQAVLNGWFIGLRSAGRGLRYVNAMKIKGSMKGSSVRLAVGAARSILVSVLNGCSARRRRTAPSLTEDLVYAVGVWTP